MAELLGQPLFEVWQELCSAIDDKYEMERVWNTGGKNWTYEYKYRRGGKTLCCLYAKSNCIGFMIIFGKDERLKVENIRASLSNSVCMQYDEAETYHDGKWVMFEPTDTTNFDDYMKLLAIKKKTESKVIILNSMFATKYQPLSGGNTKQETFPGFLLFFYPFSERMMFLSKTEPNFMERLKPLLPAAGDASELEAAGQALAGLPPEGRDLLAAVQDLPSD